MKASNCSSKGAPSAGRGSRWYLPGWGRPSLGWHHGGASSPPPQRTHGSRGAKSPDHVRRRGEGPVGGLEEDRSAIDLVGDLDVLVALHPHGVGLVPQPLDVVVHVVDTLAQLCKVTDLQERDMVTALSIHSPSSPL